MNETHAEPTRQLLATGEPTGAPNDAGVPTATGVPVTTTAAADPTWQYMPADEGKPIKPGNPIAARILDAVMSVQRPAVLAHLRSVRLRHPNAGPAEVIRILERRYLLAVTGGGAGVGAAAVVPGVTTPIALTIAGAETVGFLESTALFAQSVAEVHGLPVEDPDRARILVMTLMLGKEAGALVGQFSKQAVGRGAGRQTFWGEMVTSALPRGSVGFVVDQVQAAFMRKFVKFGAGSVIGKVLPFGIGAAVGGTGNLLLGRKVVATAQLAFGPAPRFLPDHVAPAVGAERIERRALNGLKAAGGGVAAGVASGAKKATKAITRSK